MKKGMFPRNSGILLDTNIISYSRRKSFRRGTNKWITDCEQMKNKMILPQIVEYELLRNCDSFEAFAELEKVLHKKFFIAYCNNKTLECATCINLLLHLREETKEIAKKKLLLNDLLIGAIAGQLQKKDGTTMYIASCDQVFPLPYFTPYTYFEIPHDSKLEQTAILYLFEVNIFQTNKEWIRYRSALKNLCHASTVSASVNNNTESSAAREKLSR